MNSNSLTSSNYILLEPQEPAILKKLPTLDTSALVEAKADEKTVTSSFLDNLDTTTMLYIAGGLLVFFLVLRE